MKPTGNNISRSAGFLSLDEVPAFDPGANTIQIAELAYYVTGRKRLEPDLEPDDWLEAERRIRIKAGLRLDWKRTGEIARDIEVTLSQQKGAPHEFIDIYL
jgi:hypothetical protein